MNCILSTGIQSRVSKAPIVVAMSGLARVWKIWVIFFLLHCAELVEGLNVPRVRPRPLTKVQLSPISQDLLSSFTALGGSFIWLKVWVTLAKEKKIDTKLSRKIIHWYVLLIYMTLLSLPTLMFTNLPLRSNHSGSAPLFICLWPLYSSGELQSRVIASLVPLIQMGRLAAAAGAGAGLKETNTAQKMTPVVDSANANDVSELANAISRSGDRREALGGPFIYTVVLFLCTLFGFRESPASVVAVTQMAAGDGLADIVGRRWGTVKWPFSSSKSIAGSAAFVVGAFTVSTALLLLLNTTGCMSFDATSKWPQLFLVSVLCALVELVPLGKSTTLPMSFVSGTFISWFSSHISLHTSLLTTPIL
jgi:dolichol kinase